VEKKKAVAVVGTTASGKTALAVRLADVFGGEIVSADSRQVYRGMDIGTGKDLPDYRIVRPDGQTKDMPYHLIDVADPSERYDLSRFAREAQDALADISRRGALPVLAGGSGLYAQAVVESFDLNDVQPDPDRRSELEELPLTEIARIIKERDDDFFATLNNSELNNKRRLIRYLEVLSDGGTIGGRGQSDYDWLVLGLTWPIEVLRERIAKRLKQRLDEQGMIDEVRSLHAGGLSWERLDAFGLEYRFVSQYLRGEKGREEMEKELALAIGHFAKRQMTWLRRWERQGRMIKWVDGPERAESLVKSFLLDQV
jgi:tRNA dimethylallyltransferase